MFDWLMFAYPKGMATLVQCQLAVSKSLITTDQFKAITGVDYVA